MYAGFITPKRVVTRAGIHQRLDLAAYKMIHSYLPEGGFPSAKEILHFEGYNGPDGLNTKVGLKAKGLKPKDESNPSHTYNPITDTGEVPARIAGHYAGLVEKLKDGDLIRSAFEAAWLAHFVGDGLTPAHHFPLEEKIAAAAIGDSNASDTGKITASVKKNWAIWGAKGHMTTHMNFEMGIAFALVIFPIRPEFSEHELARAGQLGPVEYFKSEARAVSSLGLYDRFYHQGWTNELAVTVKNRLAPQTARTIGTIWLLAVLEAGQQLAGAQAANAASGYTFSDPADG
jgi:hypothetical protein